MRSAKSGFWPRTCRCPAGSIAYPSPPAQNLTLAATEPLGTNRVILVVTRDQLVDFSGNATVTRAVSLAVRGGAFVAQLNVTLAILSPSDWATDRQCRVEIVRTF